MFELLTDPTVVGWVLVMVIAAGFGVVHHKVSWARIWEGGLSACTWCQEHVPETVAIAVGIFALGLAILPTPYDVLWGICGFVIAAFAAAAARVAAFTPIDFTSSDPRHKK